VRVQPPMHRPCPDEPRRRAIADPHPTDVRPPPGASRLSSEMAELVASGPPVISSGQPAVSDRLQVAPRGRRPARDRLVATGDRPEAIVVPRAEIDVPPPVIVGRRARRPGLPRPGARPGRRVHRRRRRRQQPAPNASRTSTKPARCRRSGRSARTSNRARPRQAARRPGGDAEQGASRRRRQTLAWVQAVNSKGGFGVWSGDVVVEMARMPDTIGRHRG
jgi:hypothetical protein